MFGDVLLGSARSLLELLDGGGRLAQSVQETDAHRLAENAKALRDQLDERRLERVWDIPGGAHIDHAAHDNTTTSLFAIIVV